MNNEILVLFRKFINNQCSKAELATVLKLIEEADYEQELAHILSEEEEKVTSPDTNHLPVNDLNPDLLTRIHTSIANSSSIDKPNKLHRYTKYIAAAVVLIISTVTIYVQLRPVESAPTTISKTAQVKPADENEAYLTLASGKRIALSEANLGSLATEIGVDITRTKDNELIYKTSEDTKLTNGAAPMYNKIEIPNGKRFQLNLPDGTKVWLNAGTSLRYPVSFAGLKERVVDLVGEAYFEVAHNKAMPFKVYTGKNAVEVLGTKFNVNSYQDEPSINTTLLAGSVKILSDSSNPKAASVIIQPGEQASVTPNKISINKIDTEEVMAWKNDKFNFKSQDFETVMRTISRWYDLAVVYENSTPITIKPGGWISRKNHVKEVLEMIEATGEVKFKIEGRRIIVKN